MDLAQVGEGGYRISNEEYEKHPLLYSRLYGRRYTFIEDGYAYYDVTISRVAPETSGAH